MNYAEYIFEIKPLEPWREILLAYLGEFPFESFIETDSGLIAYIQTNNEVKNLEKDINEIPLFSSNEVAITYKRNKIPSVNWNEEWEKNFDSVNIEDQIYIKAEFHEERSEFPYSLTIQPKMSFGTGHHETTYNMLKAMLEIDFENKKVLDMGCGTAVLGIFAKMRGADYVEAIDNDEWCFENSIENAKRNRVEITVKKGDASLLNKNNTFDIILANINKNILLSDSKEYIKVLNPGGILLISGFYEEDVDDLVAEISNYGMKFGEKYLKNNWVSILFNF